MTDFLTRILKPVNADDFRDKLPGSGVFEMMDCEVEIYCPELAEAEDVQKMVNTIESMINVVDIRITSTPETLHSPTYQVIIKEVPLKAAKRIAQDKKEY